VDWSATAPCRLSSQRTDEAVKGSADEGFQDNTIVIIQYASGLGMDEAQMRDIIGIGRWFGTGDADMYN